MPNAEQVPVTLDTEYQRFLDRLEPGFAGCDPKFIFTAGFNAARLTEQSEQPRTDDMCGVCERPMFDGVCDLCEGSSPAPEQPRTDAAGVRELLQRGLADALWLLNAVEGNIRRTHKEDADRLLRVWRILTALRSGSDEALLREARDALEPFTKHKPVLIGMTRPDAAGTTMAEFNASGGSQPKFGHWIAAGDCLARIDARLSQTEGAAK